MRKKKFLLTLLLLVSLLGLTGFSPQGQTEQLTIRITQLDTSNFPEVTVYVSITDTEGDPVGLDPARIILMENQQTIPVDQIQGAGEVDPLTVLLALDISGSMLYVGKLDAAKQAAKLFVNQLRSSDRVGLLTFHTEIDYIQPVTAERELILDAIDRVEAKDDTAMYDALLEGIQVLSEIKGRKAIVVITDGLDTLSQSTPETVLEQIGPAGLSISTIGLGDPDQDLAEKTALDVEALTYLAENAGGVYAYANDQESLNEVYQSYATSFKSEYQLTYTSPSVLRDGVNRALTVSIADPNLERGAESSEEAVKYNPGGLVPEVSDPVPGPIFFLLVSFLISLLFLPGAISLISRIQSKGTPVESPPEKPKPRIKLKD
jgi:VWFA-related protein